MIKIGTSDNCTFTLTFKKEKENFELSKMEFNIDGKSLNANGTDIIFLYLTFPKLYFEIHF